MNEFDDLAQFLEWWLATRPINVPPDDAITRAGVIYGLVLYRQDPYQVQLFIMPSNSTIDDHIHPNVDSYEVYLGGDINFRFNGETFAPEALGTYIRVKPNCWHGGLFGPRGGAFLSVQKWLNGKKPTTVGDDWHDASNNTVGAASLLKE